MTDDAQLVAYLKSDDPAENRIALTNLGYEVPEDYEVVEERPEPTRSDIEGFIGYHAKYRKYRARVEPKLIALGVPEHSRDVVAELAFRQLAAIETSQGPQPDLKRAWDLVSNTMNRVRPRQRTTRSRRR